MMGQTEETMRKAGRVDLHTHSAFSDGTCTPAQLVQTAREKGLAAIALTDHDTIDGMEEAAAAAEGSATEIIPGIELSTKYKEKDIHIVGLFLQYQNRDFKRALQDFADARQVRNRSMCEKMCAAGIPIAYEELQADNPGSVITRANMARFLLKKGVVSQINEAFDRYIGDEAPFFIPREKITPAKAVQFLRRFHGIPILAHPFQYKLGEEGLTALIRELKEAGLMGIEAYYCTHTPEMTAKIQALAKEYDLLLSGGSDFHGSNKPGLEMGSGYGNLAVPESCLVRMKHARYGITEDTRILFCDFDGTLANEKKEVTPATKEAIERFVSGGNIFVLSSGRAMSDVKALARRLNLCYPRQFLSAYNGAELYSCEEDTTFFRKTLPADIVREVMELCRARGIYCHTYDGDQIVGFADTRETKYYTDRVKMPVRLSEDPAGDLSEEPCKCLAIHLENQEDHALESLAAELNGRFKDVLHTVMSNPWYLEIDPACATKAYSLEWLCRHLGVEPANTIAAGDAQNDNPMLQAAGIGIGMCNGLSANPQMKEAADVITKLDNEHDGLAVELQRLMDAMDL